MNHVVDSQCLFKLEKEENDFKRGEKQYNLNFIKTDSERYFILYCNSGICRIYLNNIIRQPQQVPYFRKDALNAGLFKFPRKQATLCA